jgi:23S rRNA pseudouridine1911/1915/1917 synthase
MENVRILYEDDDVLVVDKPAGLMVHPDGRSQERTLVDWIIKERPEIEGVGEPALVAGGISIARPGIVHRIDKETSGALIIAKTNESFEHLKSAFAERLVQKQYAAFVYGVTNESFDIINRPIGKSRKDPRRWSAQRGARGQLRDAITEYRVRERGSAHTYLEVRPKTGRTHQIRVHMKAINHPIVCDSLYAPKMPPALGFERLALHAESVTFTSVSGKAISVTAPLPMDFERGLDLLRAS